MKDWTPEQWAYFLTALTVAFASIGGTVATIVLQLRGNKKTDAAAIISADNNQRLQAVVQQTHEIGAATPGVSTLSTATVLATPPATAPKT